MTDTPTIPSYTPPRPPAKAKLPEAQVLGTEAQPVSKVQWLHRDMLTANGWNPNRAATPEMVLLAVSILEDGWTEPIVVQQADELIVIIDGFHRWTVSAWPPVFAMTDGMVPVVMLNSHDQAQQRMATVRHNRARGTHYVLSMAEIVDELVGMGVSEEDIALRLQMDPEEVTRLRERGSMIKRGTPGEFGEAWKPAHAPHRDER